MPLRRALGDEVGKMGAARSVAEWLILFFPVMLLGPRMNSW